MTSFGEDYLKQRARLRESLEHYRLIGPAGAYGASMIEQTLLRADNAALNGDIRAMCECYVEMERFGNGVFWRIESANRASARANGSDHGDARTVTPVDWRCAASASG